MRSTADFKMFFLEGTELFFPYILFDTALLINFICRPRMMTWMRENWRLYRHSRCEMRSEINGIGNVASYWVSSWDSWLLLSYFSLSNSTIPLIASVALSRGRGRYAWIFTSRIIPSSLRSYRSVKVNSVCWWASDSCAVAMGFVEQASKEPEHTLPAD